MGESVNIQYVPTSGGGGQEKGPAGVNSPLATILRGLGFSSRGEHTS